MSCRAAEKVDRGSAARESILAAATELFAEKGVQSASVTAIAARAGVNRAMIGYYFGSKGGLYDAIIDAAVADAASAVSKLNIEDSGDPLREWVLTLAEVLASRPHLSRMIIYEYFQAGRLFEPETAKKLSGFVRLTEKILSAAPLSLRARRYDPQILHLILVGSINYFILTAPFRERLAGKLDRPLTAPTISEFAEILAEIVSRGLTTKP